MTCIQLPRRTYCAGHFALKRARCITMPARAGAFPWYAHLTVNICEGQETGSARKVVPYARACVWGGYHVCECCLMMTCSVCLNETTTAHGGCTPHSAVGVLAVLLIKLLVPVCPARQEVDTPCPARLEVNTPQGVQWHDPKPRCRPVHCLHEAVCRTKHNPGVAPLLQACYHHDRSTTSWSVTLGLM